jgi:hypothetical protein
LFRVDGVLKKNKKSNFFENDIHMYLRLFLEYGAKIFSQKKVMRVQSWWDCISADDYGTCILCGHETIGRSWN